MRWRSSNGDAADLWAASRAGVASRAMLTEWGVPESTVSRRCRAGGPWQRLLPGIILLSCGLPTQRQEIEAALLYAGPDAVLTGHRAARLHGLRRAAAEGEAHVLVPSRRRRQSRAFVVIERTTRLPRPVLRSDIPLAPVHRAVLDAARGMHGPDEVSALLAEAVQQRFCSVGDLRGELESGSRRGSALPRDVLVDLAAGVWSAAERRARRLALRAGLRLTWNPRLYGADGRYLGRPDAWADDVALAWQIDSFDHHSSPEDFACTAERDAEMTAAGVIVLNTAPRTLFRRPGTVFRTLLAAHEQASRRPRPAVVAVEDVAA